MRDVRGTVICGVDGSPQAQTAAMSAALVASSLKLRLVLAHVIDPDGSGDAECPTRTLESMPASLCDGLQVELRVLRGEPAQQLAVLATDEGADMIVLGSRVDGFHGRRLECALSRDLEAATDTPVVLAPTP